MISLKESVLDTYDHNGASLCGDYFTKVVASDFNGLKELIRLKLHASADKIKELLRTGQDRKLVLPINLGLLVSNIYGEVRSGNIIYRQT